MFSNTCKVDLVGSGPIRRVLYLRGYCFSENGTGVIVPLQRPPNPWRDPTCPVEDDMGGKGGEILRSLRKIIAEWPGEKTAVLGHEERHLRFIMAVAGYPDIDVATRPFDWPLSDSATEAMEVSRMLDNVIGMHEGTSLRSSLLNRDLNYRLTKDSGGDESPLEAHRDCLMLLFARTRQLDGCHLEQPKNEDSEEDGGVSKYWAFRPEEESLLGALHSYDNNRRGEWWPKLAQGKQKKSLFTNIDRGDFSTIIGTVEDPGDKPDGDYGSPEVKDWKDKKDDIKRQRKLEYFLLQNEQSLRPISFQFHYVQSWLKNNFPSGQGLDGTAQRFLRGFSIMLELVVSEARHRIARDIGIGSITVDGGGRVQFLCPEKKEDSMRRKLKEATGEFLLLQDSEAKNDLRFESTIEGWRGACTEAGHGVGESKRENIEEWFRQVQSKLPPFSVIGEVDKSEDDLITRLNNLDSPQIIKKQRKVSYVRCWFCKDEEVPKPESINQHMGVDGVLDGVREEICPFHRLLFFLGNDQRIKDSTLRPAGERGSGQYVPDIGGNREVSAIARVDGNSLGILFRERHKDEFDENGLRDRRRRRSFRFNAHWWKSLRASVNKTGRGDRVAAWVTAGDDVVLAEYKPMLEKSENGSKLKATLEKWAREIEKFDDELDEGMILSFAAGMTKKKPKEKVDGKNVYDVIVPQFLRSGTYEKMAKNRWKTMIDYEHQGSGFPSMLTKLKDDVEEKRRVTHDPDWKHSVIGDTKSIIVVEEGEHEPSEEDDICPPKQFQKWDGDLIDGFCNFYDGLDRDDEANLKRHYKMLFYIKDEAADGDEAEWTLSKTELTLLPPKGCHR